MQTVTKTVHLNADRDQAFNFLSNIENLPKWARSFCTELKREGDDYKVVNPGGELYFTIEADQETGVVDMIAGPQKEQMGAWPARVMGMPDGTSLFAFTLIKCAESSDEQFAQTCASVESELTELSTMFA